MQLVLVNGIDRSSIARAVAAGTYRKGELYARQRAVLKMQWLEDANALAAEVRGSNATSRYTTIVHFAPRNGSDLWFERSNCSCPVAVDCKHAVAAALTAAGAALPGAAPADMTASGAPRPRSAAWEQSLGALLGTAQPEPGADADGVPLALELTLVGVPPLGAAPIARRGMPTPVPQLLARLVRPGRTGWVGSALSWGKLDSRYNLPDCRESHVRLLQELYALAGAHTGTSGYYYREQKTIDLAAFASPRLWSLLDEAGAIGLQLVHPRKRLGPLPRYVEGELCLDVTAGSGAGALVVTPSLRIDTRDETEPGAECRATGTPLCFIGPGGHGAVYRPGGRDADLDPADQPIRLARLARPVPPPLQRMAVAGQQLRIPAGETDRFADSYFPQLRNLAAVVSSDGAFTPPAISGPTLVVQAAYGPGHGLDVAWEWAYQVCGKQLRAPLTPAGAGGYRDVAAERSLLDTLADLPLDRFGLRRDDRGSAAAHGALRGLDTMRFTTEVLPLLTDLPGVTVEISGEQAAYRETGDSLQVGVSTEAVAGDPDWFDLGVRITVEGREVPFADVFVALAAGETDLLLPDGAFFSLQKPELQALRSLIEEARALQDNPGGPLRISRFQAGLWDELTELGVVERQAKAWRQQVAGLLSLGELPAPEPPSTLTAALRPYQRDGFGWLAFLWQHRLGGILADDMGLGKTVQTLALIGHAKQAEPGLSPFLVVAPTSVVSNWAIEAARFAPDLRVVSISDTNRRRGQALADTIAGADVVVTSYALFRLDFDAYAELGWSGLILDEAQFAKIHQSKVHQCARRLPAPFKLAITGTPMENNLMELWSLLSITAPGLFPNPTRFRDHFARPIERQADTELLGRLRRRIRPLVKRRTKEQVAADLPPKQQQVLEVELDQRHRKIYQRHLQRERQKVLGLIGDVDRNRFTILRSLTLLRQLSLHPGLVDDEHRELSSSKIDTMLDQLTEVIDGGHRALVFSQFTRFLSHLRDRLDAAGIRYCYLDGSTRNRPAVVQEFKDGAAPVFLISLKAGGFGLNLTEADYCFLLDPWWNPATEAQAVDRTHRIGQTRTVMVYRLIARDTIEEKVLALANRKAELFSGVMDEGNVFGSTLDADDIRELLA